MYHTLLIDYIFIIEGLIDIILSPLIDYSLLIFAHLAQAFSFSASLQPSSLYQGTEVALPQKYISMVRGHTM